MTTIARLLTSLRLPLLAVCAACLTGCATILTQDVGVRQDRDVHFQRILFDGEKVYVRYTAKVSPIFGSHDEPAVETIRWAEARLSENEWKSDGCTCLEKMHILHDPAHPPEQVAQIEIPLTTGIIQAPIADKAPASPPNPDPPFRAQANGETITLIRRDPAHPDKTQTAPFAPPTYTDAPYASLKRGVIYPFAVVFDVVTSPVQAVYFLCCFNTH